MIAKEWRDARWKFLVATVLVLLLSTYLTPYAEILEVAEQINGRAASNAETKGGSGADRDPASLPPAGYDPERMALNEMWGFYNVGGLVTLGSLALVLGATLVSGETGAGTILLLLSRPLRRTRILLTKYAVCAAILLASAMLGGVLILTVAALRGYPLENVSLAGILLLGLMMWLVSLFVLAVALLASVLFRGIIPSLAAAALLLLLILTFPGNLLNVAFFLGPYFMPSDQGWYGFLLNLAPGRYLIASGIFEGKALGATKFLYWTVAATIPLLTALWLFRRRSY